MASGYTPLPDGLPSPDGGPQSFAPPLPAGSQQRRSLWDRAKTWTQARVRVPWARQAQEAPPPSGYLTLIPLSDARLQPRDTRLTAAWLLLFALFVAGAVFVTVPRGVSIGEVTVKTDRIAWNTTKSTYQLKLLARLPVYNPNYLTATIEGDLHILFYRTVAGRSQIQRLRLPPRAAPKMVEVSIDASEVPSDYILAILSQCSTFPEMLIFFLKGRLMTRYLFMRQHLATLDTYFLINCKDPSMAAAQAEMLRQLPDRIGGGLAQPLPLLHTG